ncbi:MAG: 50S ribosomal protein L18 [Crenarchaeota archaeon]|nr:50S ribosomal protein L18 [Thermoproteota archaeon]
MAWGPKYKVPRRRRREGKTNYYKRYKLVRSRKIRVVVRKTNKYIWVQFIYPTPVGDFTIAAAHSKELVKYFGWKGGTKSTPAAYLTGLLAGLRAKKLGIDYAVPDIGLHRPTKGAKVFAALKGVVDAGVEVPLDESIVPSEDRIRGETIARYAETLASENPERFQRQFSQMLAKGFDPRELPRHFEEVKNLIMQVYSSIPESTAAREIVSKLVAAGEAR